MRTVEMDKIGNIEGIKEIYIYRIKNDKLIDNFSVKKSCDRCMDENLQNISCTYAKYDR